MTLTNSKNANKEYINKMYDSQLQSQKESLKQSYDKNMGALDKTQRESQIRTDANLNRTNVEASKAAKNYAEVQSASGLTSGAMAQARLAQDNQLQKDLTLLRLQQQQSDSDIDRERNLLGQQYASEIAKAQADNDMGRAQALYQAAKEEEAQLRADKMAAGKLMSSVGDVSILAELYGLTPEQVAALQASMAGSGSSGSSGGRGGGGGGNPGGLRGPERKHGTYKPSKDWDKKRKTGGGMISDVNRPTVSLY